MKHIELKPNATRLEVIEYINNVVGDILSQPINDDNKIYAKENGYIDGEYYTSATKKEIISGFHAYLIMRTLIENLLFTRLEYIDSSILAICLNLRTNDLNIRYIKPLIKNPKVDETYIQHSNGKERQEFYKLSKKGFLTLMSSIKLKNFVVMEIINQYFLDLDILSNAFVFFDTSTMREHRSHGKGITGRLRMLLRRLTFLSNEPSRKYNRNLHIPFDVTSTWIYRLLRFPKDYSRTKNPIPIKLNNPTEKEIEDEAKRMRLEMIRIFLITVVEDAICSGIFHCIENGKIEIGYDVGTFVPNALRLTKRRNHKVPEIQAMLTYVDMSELYLRTKRN